MIKAPIFFFVERNEGNLGGIDGVTFGKWIYFDVNKHA